MWISRYRNTCNKHFWIFGLTGMNFDSVEASGLRIILQIFFNILKLKPNLATSNHDYLKFGYSRVISFWDRFYTDIPKSILVWYILHFQFIKLITADGISVIISYTNCEIARKNKDYGVFISDRYVMNHVFS